MGCETSYPTGQIIEPISILFISANPWTTSRILVDEEAREIFEKLQEGPYRKRFVLHKHAAIRPTDIQRLLMMYRPQIVHFSGHSSRKQKLILGGVSGRGKQINRRALVNVFALYREVRLVFLNACFTQIQAHSLSEVIDYSIGSRKPIGDRESVAFAGAFYRALGFGRSVTEAFASAKAEVALANMTRAQGLELFIRKGVDENDRFPQARNFDDQLAEMSQCPCRLSSTDAGRPSVNVVASKPDTENIWDAIDLLQRFLIDREDEPIRQEQFVIICEHARQLQLDPAESSLPVRTALENGNARYRHGQPSKTLASTEVGALPPASTSAVSAVTVEHRVLKLTRGTTNPRNDQDPGARGARPNKLCVTN